MKSKNIYWALSDSSGNLDKDFAPFNNSVLRIVFYKTKKEASENITNLYNKIVRVSINNIK